MRQPTSPPPGSFMFKPRYYCIQAVTLLVFIIILNSFSPLLHAVEIIKLSEIKVGMKGEGKTIFKGTQAETFQFTVLGIIEKFAPDKNLIIIDIESPNLKDGGIVSGMSGSPAYIDGKLAGAVAYGFSFSKKPIGGITPIEDILKTSDFNTPTVSVDVSTMKVEFDKENLAAIANYLQKELAGKTGFSPAKAFSPIQLLGTQRGFTPGALSALQPVMSFTGGLKFSASQDTGQGKTRIPSKIDKKMFELNPADAVSVSMITGDYELSAIGTVTHVDGDKVYIFGHPYYNLGTVDIPLYKAEVITVVPSFETSFKLGASRNMVGRIVQDRFSAVYGELGNMPYMIPLNVYTKNTNRQLHIEIINHPLLTPILAAVAMQNVFSVQFQDLGFQSIRVNGKIYIEGERNIEISNLYSGTNSASDFSNLLLAINFFLLNNKEKNIKIQKIDFEISGSENIQISNIEDVLVEKKSYLPGEIMNIGLYLRNEKGATFFENVSIGAPNLKAGSDFYVMVADGEEMSLFDSRNVRTGFFPTRLNHLIRAINNLRRNNRLYIKIISVNPGLFVKGYEYSNLPSSMQSVFNFEKSPIYESPTESQSTIKYSTITEYQIEFPTVIKGNKMFKLKIKERSDGQ